MNFNNISYTLTDILGKKSTIGTGSTYSVTRCLNSFGSISTVFGHNVAYCKRIIHAKFYPMICIVESEMEFKMVLYEK